MTDQVPNPIEYASGPLPTDALRADAASSVVRRVFRAVAWRMLLGFVLGLFVLALWFGVAPVIAIVGTIGVVILIPVLAASMRQVRRRRALVVLAYLEQAVRLNLPLPRMLDAAQRSERGWAARRLTRLVSLLDSGAPVGGALAVSVPETPGRVLGVVAAAERLGQLPAALSRVVEDERADVEADPERQSFVRWYPLLMGVMLSLILMVILVYVMPKFEEIFHDFGVRLPGVTRKLLGIGRLLTHSDVLLVVIFVLLGGVAINVLGGALRAIFEAGDPGAALAAARGSPTWVGWDRVVWWTPVAHGIARDRGLADACRTIADAMRTGRPLVRAIDEAAQLRVNGVLRGRLVEWRERIERGEAPDRAARGARLPELFCGMIGPGAGGPGGVAPFEFLADYYASRVSRARELIRAALVPALVLGFAAVVLFVILALFAPLISMMDHLTAGVLGGK